MGLPKPFIRVECISTLASPHAEQKGNLKKGPSFIIVDSCAGVWAENTFFFSLRKTKTLKMVMLTQLQAFCKLQSLQLIPFFLLFQVANEELEAWMFVLCVHAQLISGV